MKQICPECSSLNTNKFGFSYTKRGEIRRYLCRDCGHTFYDEADYVQRRKQNGKEK